MVCSKPSSKQRSKGGKELVSSCSSTACSRQAEGGMSLIGSMQGMPAEYAAQTYSCRHSGSMQAPPETGSQPGSTINIITSTIAATRHSTGAPTQHVAMHDQQRHAAASRLQGDALPEAIAAGSTLHAKQEPDWLLQLLQDGSASLEPDGRSLAHPVPQQRQLSVEPAVVSPESECNSPANPLAEQTESRSSPAAASPASESDSHVDAHRGQRSSSPDATGCPPAPSDNLTDSHPGDALSALRGSCIMRNNECKNTSGRRQYEPPLEDLQNAERHAILLLACNTLFTRPLLPYGMAIAQEC